jgi:hypothetical protein
MVNNIQKGLILSVVLLALSACSTLTKSTLTGAGAGAAFGGIAGSLVPGDSHKPQNIIIGAVAGGTLGALSGALIHKTMEDHEREAFEKGKNSKSNDQSHGALVSSGYNSGSRHYVPPKIERRFVGDEIHGNTLVEAHYEQVVVEEGHWE